MSNRTQRKAWPLFAVVLAGLSLLTATRVAALTADIATDANGEVLDAERRFFTDSSLAVGVPNGSVVLFIADTGGTGTPLYNVTTCARRIHPDDLFDADDVALFTAITPGPSLLVNESSRGRYLDLGRPDVDDIALTSDIYVLVWDTTDESQIVLPGGPAPSNRITCDIGRVTTTPPNNNVGNHTWLIEENLLFRWFTISSDPFWADAQDIGGGWRFFPWFGYFNILYSPWIYHQLHGYLHLEGTDPTCVWVWNETMQSYWWLSSNYYPTIYRQSDDTWIWYLPNSWSPRWFYNFSSGRWEAW